METKEKRIKQTYLEALRIIACFFVIVNHTASGEMMAKQPETKFWFIFTTYFFLLENSCAGFFDDYRCKFTWKSR